LIKDRDSRLPACRRHGAGMKKDDGTLEEMNEELKKYA